MNTALKKRTKQHEYGLKKWTKKHEYGLKKRTKKHEYGQKNVNTDKKNMNMDKKNMNTDKIKHEYGLNPFAPKRQFLVRIAYHRPPLRRCRPNNCRPVLRPGPPTATASTLFS